MKQYTYTGPSGECPYFVYMPRAYQVGEMVALVVMLHGCTQKAVDFAAGTHMNDLAERHNFIVVYPQQTRAANRYGCWNWFQPANQVRDGGEVASIVGVVREMLHKTAQWTIDARRVYVAGISAGGAMAVTLGATYPDVFAAIGVHSGVAYQAASNAHTGLRAMRRGGPDPIRQGAMAYTAMGEYARVVPTIVFHGTYDFTVSSINGDQVIQQWMQTNMLAAYGKYVADFQQPSSVVAGKVPAGYSYVTQTWNDMHGREIQQYWKINTMGHAWSGGKGGAYMDHKGPDASEAMYRFFQPHALRKAKLHVISSEGPRTPFWKHVVHSVVELLHERKDS